MNTKNKINFSLNFGGFYHSEHSETIENNIELYGYDWEEVDYTKTHTNYCKAFLNRLGEELDVNLSFISLDSPRQYNFTTDKIFCSISDKDFKALLSTYDTKELYNYIEEHSKSRSGFTSFYSGYAEVKKETDIFLQYLFNYILIDEDFNIYDLEYETEIKETNLIKQ
tara:strand:- start:515 stop:1018 length:504 start_codon:yes stop_codon:yes gene_type:complete